MRFNLLGYAQQIYICFVKLGISLLKLHSKIWKASSVSDLHFSLISPVLGVRPPARRTDFPCSGGTCPVCSSDHWRVNTSSELLPKQQHCYSPVSRRVSLHFHPKCPIGIAQSLASHYQMLFTSVTKSLLFSLLTHKISLFYPQLPLDFPN